MQAILWPIIVWLLREVVIRFVVLSACFMLVKVFGDVAVGYLANQFDTSSLKDAFGSLPADVWYFLSVFRVDIGISLTISAYATRFLIRRLPFVG